MKDCRNRLIYSFVAFPSVAGYRRYLCLSVSIYSVRKAEAPRSSADKPPLHFSASSRVIGGELLGDRILCYTEAGVGAVAYKTTAGCSTDEQVIDGKTVMLGTALRFTTGKSDGNANSACW